MNKNTNMPHLCKAKLKSPDPKWEGKWVEGYPAPPSFHQKEINQLLTCFDGTSPPYFNTIYPETLCWFTGYADTLGNKIYQNDIVKFYIGKHLAHEILIWWNQECMVMSAIEINKGFSYNGWDFFNTDNRLNNYTTFCLQVKNLYDDYTKIESVGNLFDSHEIMDFYKALAVEKSLKSLEKELKDENCSTVIKNSSEKIIYEF